MSQWLRLTCAKLRVRHLNTKAYSPEAKGKSKDSTDSGRILQESTFGKILRPLSALTTYSGPAVGGYNHRVHSSLSGKSPAQAFSEDIKALRFPSPETLRDALLWEKTPKVDKSGLFSLQGLCYEAGVEWIGKNYHGTLCTPSTYLW